MKRLITQLALLIAVLCASIPAHAYDCNVGGIYYNLNSSDKTAEVTKGDEKYKGSINIPESITYEGSSYSVTSIGELAFGYCSGLTSVTIPNSVTSIGDEAFRGCSGLTSVTIPNSVTSIGYSAFYDCSGLTSVTIPESVTEIGSSAFSYCSGLTSVTIPNSVTSIGTYAFKGCTGLTSVTIPNSVTSIGEFAFHDCRGLTSVTIPNSVTSIGNYAFNSCSGLTSIVVDKGNVNYDSRNNCNAIIETATNKLITGCSSTIIPNSVTSIGEYAFDGRTGLTSVTIPNSVTSIGDEAFHGCTGLTSVTIPNSVTSIGSGAFSSCRGLTSVTIGMSVTSIGKGAFSLCSGLTSIVVDENNTVFDSRNNCNAIIETATNTLITGCNSTIIPNSVTSIGSFAFYGSGLTSVTIPNSVTSIGEDAFGYCSGLTSVTIGNLVTSIGEYAFYNCSGLKVLTCLAPNPPACDINAFTGIDKSKCTLYVIKESVNVYKIADQWKDFYNISEYDGVDDITVDADDAATLYDVYNIQGVKVAGGLRRAEMSDALPHGIYILVSPNATRKEKI